MKVTELTEERLTLFQPRNSVMAVGGVLVLGLAIVAGLAIATPSRLVCERDACRVERIGLTGLRVVSSFRLDALQGVEIRRERGEGRRRSRTDHVWLNVDGKAVLLGTIGDHPFDQIEEAAGAKARIEAFVADPRAARLEVRSFQWFRTSLVTSLFVLIGGAFLYFALRTRTYVFDRARNRVSLTHALPWGRRLREFAISDVVDLESLVLGNTPALRILLASGKRIDLFEVAPLEADGALVEDVPGFLRQRMGLQTDQRPG